MSKKQKNQALEGVKYIKLNLAHAPYEAGEIIEADIKNNSAHYWLTRPGAEEATKEDYEAQIKGYEVDDENKDAPQGNQEGDQNPPQAETPPENAPASNG